MQKRLIRFGDVKFDRAAKERINEILLNGNNTEGAYVEEFESKFAEAFGFKHTVMTSSGTTAGEVLWMAVAASRGLRWGAGSVVTPALSFVAAANCIMRAGLSPTFHDISDDLNLGFHSEHYIMEIGVQFVLNMGRTIGIASWRRRTQNAKSFFMIDACEGHGAEFEGKRISDLCDAAIYSFYPAHIMTVGGEGGMIATNNKNIADLCRSIKSHGRPVGTITHDFERIGTNAKTTEIAAAVGLSALANFPDNFMRRRAIRAGLLERLAEFELDLYPDAPGEVIAPHAFPLCVKDASLFKPFAEHLKTWQIEAKPLWGSLSNHGAYQWLDIPKGYFPVAEDIGQRGLHFGCHESYSDDDLDYIYNVIKLFFHGDFKQAA